MLVEPHSVKSRLPPPFHPRRSGFHAAVDLALAAICVWLLTGCRSVGAPFTIVVLPDTQCYCDTRLAQSAARWGNGDLREYFFAQTRWIRDSADALDIAFVVHEGDITQTDDAQEWRIAREAMGVIDGVVPYCLCLGNHDIGYRKKEGGPYEYSTAVDRSTLFAEHFPREKFASEPWFGGTFDHSCGNSWVTFAESGMEFLILALEFKPRDVVLQWANQVVAEHPDHRVILVTHSYLNGKNERATTDGYAVEGNSGEEIWQKLVSRHESFFLVLCGHVLGEGRLTSTGRHGNEVHQLLCDYQGLHNGGESWLRYMTFHPLDDRIEVFSYNPSLGVFKGTETSRFTLRYGMLGEAGEAVERRPASLTGPRQEVP